MSVSEPVVTFRGHPRYYQRNVPMNEALNNAREAAKLSTIPGTSVMPIKAVDVKLNKETGILTVNVIEDFSTVEVKPNR